MLMFKDVALECSPGASAIPVKHAFPTFEPHPPDTTATGTNPDAMHKVLPGLVLTASDENTSTGAWALRQRHAYMLHGTTQKAHNILGVHLDRAVFPSQVGPLESRTPGLHGL